MSLPRTYLFKAGKWSAYRSDIHDYMHRWIFSTPWGMLRLHHILRSDDDRDLHDHPADFASLILAGGYQEVVHGKLAVNVYGPFSVVRRKAEDLHRIMLNKYFDHIKDCEVSAWTLVWMHPRRREWGFLKEDTGEWIHHDKYFKDS